MTNLYTRFLLDALCWTGLTAALLYFDLNVAAALVGSFGLIYLARCVRTIRMAHRLLRELEEEFNAHR